MTRRGVLPARARLRAAIVAIAALPVVMGPGKCGFILDFTETLLIPQPFERVVLGADDGSVVATMYERDAALIKRHTYGFEPSLGVSRSWVEDGTLNLEARCKYEGNCSFDHMMELPRGVAVEIGMHDAQVSLGYIDGDTEVNLVEGWFRGVRLRSPNTAIGVTTGDVSLDFEVPPETVTVEVGEGKVDVKVPAGSYRCLLVADAGQVVNTGVTCDDAAAAVLDLHVQTGDIAVTGE